METKTRKIGMAKTEERRRKKEKVRKNREKKKEKERKNHRKKER